MFWAQSRCPQAARFALPQVPPLSLPLQLYLNLPLPPIPAFSFLMAVFLSICCPRRACLPTRLSNAHPWLSPLAANTLLCSCFFRWGSTAVVACVSAAAAALARVVPFLSSFCYFSLPPTFFFFFLYPGFTHRAHGLRIARLCSFTPGSVCDPESRCEQAARGVSTPLLSSSSSSSAAAGSPW